MKQVNEKFLHKSYIVCNRIEQPAHQSLRQQIFATDTSAVNNSITVPMFEVIVKQKLNNIDLFTIS